jgi:hypothetical protein
MLFHYDIHEVRADREHAPRSLGLSATSQQYFSLTTNQQPASSTLFSEQTSTFSEQTSTSRPNRLMVSVDEKAQHSADNAEDHHRNSTMEYGATDLG